MLFTRGRVLTLDLLQKEEDTGKESTSFEGEILLSASSVCGWSFYVHQCIVLFGAAKLWDVGVSNAQSIICSS